MPDLESLSSKLKSTDTEERREAAVDLGRAGKEAVPLLFRALADTDWRVRKTAVEALVSAGGERVVGGLIETLNIDDNAGARNSAIEALVQIGGPAVGSLLPLLTTPDPDVRKFVIDILGDIRDPQAVSALIERLADADENVAVAAAESLGKIGDPRAVDALLVCLSRTDRGWLDYAAAEALGEIGDERALGPLIAALGRGSLREPVLEALGRIGNVRTIGPLIESIADPLRIVREVSVVALSAIYRKSPAADRTVIIESVRSRISDRSVELLEEILLTGSGGLQKAAVAILGWTGRERSINRLLAILKEEELEEPVAQSLRHLEAGKAGFLIGFLASDNALVRRTIARVLGEIGNRIAEVHLLPLLKDENGHVRKAAAAALGSMRSRQAVPTLLELLEDEYEDVQEAAIHALAAIGDEAMLEGLIRDFSSRDAFLRRNIALLLGRFGSDKALDALAFALKDEESDVRKAVVSSLGAAADRALRSLLLAITDDDPEVRMLAAEALGGSASQEAREGLTALLADADLWVRAAAARGLGRIGGAEAGNALVAHLETASDIFLLALVEVLGAMNLAKAREPLLHLARHEDPEVRKTVLGALAGYAGADVVQTVAGRLSDPHWSVRKAAVEVLKHRRDTAVDTQLAGTADHDPDPAVRQAAKEALGT